VKIRWIRGNESITYNRPHTWLALGVRGSGKSSHLEHVGEGYLEKGHAILDLWGSRDGENLAWLRSRWVKDKRVCLIHGDNVVVESENGFPAKNVRDVILRDFYDFDILISASPLYANADQQFLETNHLTDLLYQRFTWNRLVYTIVREASNLYYSRLRVSENQLIAKASFVYMLREARHMGVALGLDTLRFYAIDIDVRSLADFTILKSQGAPGLTKDLKWLYKYFEPSLIRNMPPDAFVVLTKKGSLGLGVFPEIPWHKQERENIIKTVGLNIEYVTPSEEKPSLDRGTYKTVSDGEHVEMVRLRSQGLSIHKIAEELRRSTHTPHEQLKAHNDSIMRNGYCVRCHRANGELAETTL